MVKVSPVPLITQTLCRALASLSQGCCTGARHAHTELLKEGGLEAGGGESHSLTWCEGCFLLSANVPADELFSLKDNVEIEAVLAAHLIWWRPSLFQPPETGSLQ